jgi:uncharacterized RDD family membrane protein YckC
MQNMNEQFGQSEQKDLLADGPYDQPEYIYASQGQRFLNWLIDNLFMNYGLSYLTGFVAGILLRELAPDFLSRLAYSGSTFSFEILSFSLLVGYSNYILYYTLCEKLLKGYTLGKIITGTRAIRQDGTELTFKNALLRSLSRCVPFEVFSGFGTLTWHDGWTDTMVIKTR